MGKFLNNKKGETLVETLAAILIFTMASIILYSMVTTASKVNIKAREYDKDKEQQLIAAEHADTPAERGTVTMTIYDKLGDGAAPVTGGAKTVEVEIFRENEDSLSSYYKVIAP